MTVPPLMPGPEDPARVFSQIRANIAFEQMLVAVLIAAGISGALMLLANVFFAIAKGAGSFVGLLAIGIDAVYFSFVAFLIGFAAAIIVGLPLFLTLEKARLRKAWPYVLAAIAIEYVAYSVHQGHPLMVDDLSLPAGAILFVPGVLAALLFGQRMRPLWRAAERAESAPSIYVVQ